MDIKDKIIIVTGASQGIGLSTAKLLSEQGAKIVLAARSENIFELAKELPESIAIKTDMTSAADIKKLVGETIKKFGRIDVLINNAGQGMYSSVENIKIEDFKKVVELNLFSVVSAMQEVIPIMRQQGGGTIINVSSAVTRNYYPGLSAYSATKYALNAISFTARQELAVDNITVSVILPKMTTTNFGLNSIGARPDSINKLIKDRVNDIVIDTPELVAIKISELISSGKAELFV